MTNHEKTNLVFLLNSYSLRVIQVKCIWQLWTERQLENCQLWSLNDSTQDQSTSRYATNWACILDSWPGEHYHWLVWLHVWLGYHLLLTWGHMQNSVLKPWSLLSKEGTDIHQETLVSNENPNQIYRSMYSKSLLWVNDSFPMFGREHFNNPHSQYNFSVKQ